MLSVGHWLLDAIYGMQSTGTTKSAPIWSLKPGRNGFYARKGRNRVRLMDGGETEAAAPSGNCVAGPIKILCIKSAQQLEQLS